MERQELTNIMELMVRFKYNDIKDILNVCQCEKCRLDMMSYALNRLPSKYVVSEKGEAYSKIAASSVQFDSDILCALVEGARQVREHPRHGADEFVFGVSTGEEKEKDGEI